MIPFGRAREIASLNMWMSASMTGTNVGGTCLETGQVALSWWNADEDAGMDFWYSVDDASDPTRCPELAVKLLEAGWDGDPRCPEAVTGWELTPYLASGVSEGLATIWVPCAEHEADVTVDMNGEKWTWQASHGGASGRWVPAEA